MESIMTYGAEGRLSFGPLVLALGKAQPIQSKYISDIETYFRMALINPF
jgi:hypothetical protein